MSRNEKLIILCNALNTFALGMGAVFMNVYLYTYTGSLTVMALYTCIRMSMYPICFTLAGKLARKISFGTTLSIGLIFLVAQFLLVLTCSDLIGTYRYLIYVVALLYGIGESFYYLSVNTLNQLVSSSKTRNMFVSISGILSNVANVLAPLLASIIIDLSLNDIDGYINIFKMVVIVFIIVAILGFMVKEKGSQLPFSVLKELTFQNDPQWKYVLMTYFLYGFRESLILALAGILVYNATESSGSLYSQLLAIFALLTILGYMYTSKKMVRNNRMKFYTLGAIMLSSSTIVLVLVPNIYGAIYYGVVNAIGQAFYSAPFTMITMNAMSDYEGENLVGKVVARETYLTLSRCLSMLFIVLCYYLLDESLYLYVSVFILSLFPIIHLIYSNHYHKIKDQSREK